MDLVFTHTYGVESAFLDETATHCTALSRNPNSIFSEVKMVAKWPRLGAERGLWWFNLRSAS